MNPSRSDTRDIAAAPEYKGISTMYGNGGDSGFNSKHDHSNRSRYLLKTVNVLTVL
jgi:hypothetical protein